MRATLPFLLPTLLACATVQMKLPSDLGADIAQLKVEGRGDFTPGYTIGSYEITAQTGGWASGTNVGIMGVDAGFASAPYGLALVAPSGHRLEVVCEARAGVAGVEVARVRVGSTVEDSVSCTIDGAKLQADRPSGAVHGTLQIGERVVAIDPIVGIEGSEWKMASGIRFSEGGATLAALQTINTPRMVFSTRVDGDDRERIAAAAAAILGWPETQEAAGGR